MDFFNDFYGRCKFMEFIGTNIRGHCKYNHPAIGLTGAHLQLPKSSNGVSGKLSVTSSESNTYPIEMGQPKSNINTIHYFTPTIDDGVPEISGNDDGSYWLPSILRRSWCKHV